MMNDFKQPGVPGDDQDQLISPARYRRMLVVAVLSVSVVAVLPLLVMSAITYYQYQEALNAGLTRPMIRFAETGQESRQRVQPVLRLREWAQISGS